MPRTPYSEITSVVALDASPPGYQVCYWTHSAEASPSVGRLLMSGAVAPHLSDADSGLVHDNHVSKALAFSHVPQPSSPLLPKVEWDTALTVASVLDLLRYPTCARGAEPFLFHY